LVIKKESITMHGNMNVKCYSVCALYVFRTLHGLCEVYLRTNLLTCFLQLYGAESFLKS